MDYNICIEMQQQVYLRKVINATADWCKRLRVCIHVKGGLSEYLVWLEIIHLNKSPVGWLPVHTGLTLSNEYWKILLFILQKTSFEV